VSGARVPSGKRTTEAALGELLEMHRAAGRRIVFTNGAFDVLHVGHVRALEAAAALGDVLVVAVNADEAVRTSRGVGRPHVALEERMEVLAGLGCVDHVIPFADSTVARLLDVLRPDVHAKGRDYDVASLPERATNERLGIEMAFVGDEKRRSATGLVERIRAAADDDAVSALDGTGVEGLVATAWRAVLTSAGGLDPARWAEATDGELVEGTARRWVRRTRVGQTTVYVKVTRPAEAKRSPIAEYRNHLALRAAGLRAPQPLLALEGEAHGTPIGVLVTREAPGTALDHWLASNRCDRAAARGIGRAVAALHAAGFRFPDLQAWHLLVEGSPAGGPDAITFIDLQRLDRRIRPPSRRRAARGLAALALSLRPVTSARFRLRILRAYLGTLVGARPWLRAARRRMARLEGRGTFRHVGAGT
jgi:rfaE bifunctional protein nucleotidyltransferase chain/domain